MPAFEQGLYIFRKGAQSALLQDVAAKHDSSKVTVPSWKLESIHDCLCAVSSVHDILGSAPNSTKRIYFFKHRQAAVEAR